MQHTPTRRALVLAAATLLLGMAPGSARAQSLPTSFIGRALESRARGSDDAPVVVFEVADFQCPYCGEFARTVGPEVQAKYVQTGKVKWVFVNLPLVQNHPRAWIAAEAALCAGGAGGAFWEMHDSLFAHQDVWTRDDDPAARFESYAAAIGVPLDEYRACVADDRVAPIIVQDLGSAISAGISGTPTFIITRKGEELDQLVGVQSLEKWSEVLDRALKPES